jgi:long-chain acyl-CoA synthetase
MSVLNILITFVNYISIYFDMNSIDKSFNALIEASIKKNWDVDALTDYKGSTLQYRDVARKIEKLHILFEEAGVQKGDKIALCGRNSSNWGVAFLAILTYGAVAVPILHEFKSDNVHNIVNHSEAKLLFVGDVVWENLNEAAMPHLEGIIMNTDYSVLLSRNEKLSYAREHLNEMFGKKYPKNFRIEHVSYHKDSPEELAVINYTSGTTSYSKGVMLPYRSIWSNVRYALDHLPLNPGDSIVSMLPMAHMYGLAFEFLYEICAGCHVYFLTRMPSPKIVFQAFTEIKPNLIIAVPLIIEKIIKKTILPRLQTPQMKILLKVPLINDKIKSTIREQIINAFGGRFYELILGGAPFNQEVENFLHMINFPYTIGYGMTECGPLITYAYWKTFIKYSCGRVVDRMELKVLSPDPQHEVGEVIVRGDCVMQGYYKHEEATAEVLDKDGWLHTGDLGLLDQDGNLFLKGRSKNLLLSANGQNIYPEEIEDKLNTLPYVAESIVVQQNSKLVALIYPDFDDAFAHGLDNAGIEKIMEQNRLDLNTQLPIYSQISKIKIYPEEFEKTPKRSIKRFLYQEAKG